MTSQHPPVPAAALVGEYDRNNELGESEDELLASQDDCHLRSKLGDAPSRGTVLHLHPEY